MSASPLRNVYLALHCKIHPRRKNNIFGYIWHTSFIQTAKCSLLDEKIVYQSFYGVPLMFRYFLLRGKVLCFGTHRRDLRDIYCRRPCRENYISGYNWHKSFIQMVKCSFSNQIIIVYQSFCGALLTLSYFLLQGKVLCFGSRVGKSVTFQRPCRKNCISGYIWPKSYIQMVKCSFFNQKNVYQSFCGALLISSYFLLQGKVLCFGSHIGKSVTWEMFIV